MKEKKLIRKMSIRRLRQMVRARRRYLFSVVKRSAPIGRLMPCSTCRSQLTTVCNWILFSYALMSGNIQKKKIYVVR